MEGENTKHLLQFIQTDQMMMDPLKKIHSVYKIKKKEKSSEVIQVTKNLFTLDHNRMKWHSFNFHKGRPILAQWLPPWLSIHLHICILPVSTSYFQSNCCCLREGRTAEERQPMNVLYNTSSILNIVCTYIVIYRYNKRIIMYLSNVLGGD